MPRKTSMTDDSAAQSGVVVDLSGKPATVALPVSIETPADMADVMAVFKAWADATREVESVADALKALKETHKAAVEDEAAAKRAALEIARTGKGVRGVRVAYEPDLARRVFRAYRMDLDREDPAAMLGEVAMTAGEVQAFGDIDEQPPAIATDDATVRGVLAAAH